LGGFIVIVVAGIAVLVILAMMKQAKLADESWRQVAGRLALHPSRGGLFRPRSMGGRHLGFPVRVWTFTQSAGKSSQTYTRFEVQYPSLRLGLQLEHQGLVSKITRMFGAQDHLIGHPMFDDNVVIKGRNVRDIKEYLTPERRVRILRALESFPGLVIMDARLVYTARGLLTDAERLPNVTIMGHTDDMPGVYRDTRILLYPSRYDPHPRTPLEASIRKSAP